MSAPVDVDQRPEGAPPWWGPLPKPPHELLRGNIGYRLVEILEHGWDLRIRCLTCNAHKTMSYEDFTVRYVKYLGACGTEFAKRLTCECGANWPQMYVTNGHYHPTWMAGDYLEERARWIRQVLTGLGLDAGRLGYPPLPVDFGRK